MDHSADVEFRQLHESMKQLSVVLSDFARHEREKQPLREEAIKMLPTILAALDKDSDTGDTDEIEL